MMKFMKLLKIIKQPKTILKLLINYIHLNQSIVLIIVHNNNTVIVILKIANSNIY